ncbi:MAG: oligosaccharide flippase family protein [Sphingopyxis sp.]|uniref:oligosaccharide flippase family protein n=1 Tax=Sphingopyxis sp. TaxID=1908224 RepID=UPI002ABB0568|nr:oligosaccharide flippase family protein [Sphingopyxis sp.]MDZ3830809.1 oligosaccharide flippase family protein [Sphingopyxis sp.]
MTRLSSPFLSIAARLPARGRAFPLGPLARGFGAMGSAEMVSRLVRLATTVVIARQLAPEIVGQAALALTLFELVRVLERTGTGQEIIRAAPEDLARTCNGVRQFYVAWSGALMLLQLLVAAALGALFGHRTAALMLAALAFVWPFMAMGHVSYFLILRDRRAGRVASINASQVIADQLLTAALLLAWPSPWSIVLPKLLTAPLWLAMARRAAPWRFDPAAGCLPFAAILRNASRYLLADGFAAVRTYGDNLIVAATMGTTALGTYYFAFNAGLGIVTSLVGAYCTIAFPTLCAASEGDERRAAMRRIGAGAALVFVPLVGAQALLAPLYVPLVFGAHWAFAAPLIATLCLAGLPLAASMLTATWLRAHGRVGTDAIASMGACAAALGGLAIGASFGSLQAAVVGLVAGQALASAFYAGRILWPVLFTRENPTLLKEQIA